jgi:hypothetical protein
MWLYNCYNYKLVLLLLLLLLLYRYFETNKHGKQEN